jgi:hypothetical protein
VKIDTRIRAAIMGPLRRAIVIAKATKVRMPKSPMASAPIQTPKVKPN